MGFQGYELFLAFCAPNAGVHFFNVVSARGGLLVRPEVTLLTLLASSNLDDPL